MYRGFVRAGRKFYDYNMREYVLRRTRERFSAAKGEKDSSKLAELYSKGLKELEVVKRQSSISAMYGRGTYVMDEALKSRK
mmetsp:Transcript_42143/g.89934  ORF Transcript_42143/g.89934 Transcript_42143/m.89934 type:complete len:81 (+) Transcript_42143:2-244(+)